MFLWLSLSCCTKNSSWHLSLRSFCHIKTLKKVFASLGRDKKESFVSDVPRSLVLTLLALFLYRPICQPTLSEVSLTRQTTNVWNALFLTTSKAYHIWNQLTVGLELIYIINQWNNISSNTKRNSLLNCVSVKGLNRTILPCNLEKKQFGQMASK